MANTPVTHCPRPGGTPLQVFRCRVDDTLLTDSTLSKGACAGHKIAQPVALSDLEVLGIWLRLIR